MNEYQKGGKKQYNKGESNAAKQSQNKTIATCERKSEEGGIDYTLEENWPVTYFIDHDKVVKKNALVQHELVARWKSLKRH